MFRLLTSLSNVIFSERATELSIKNLTPSEINSLYSPGQFNSFVYLTNYQNDIVQAAIKENKFYNNDDATNILATWLGLWTKHQIDNTLYLPIPLSGKRKRERGYNQVEKILQATKPALTINCSSLRKRRHTRPQAELNRHTRLENLKDVFSFQLTEADLHQYRQIVIVDDVVTTGTTLKEARATLLPHIPAHISVTCLAIAH